MKIRYLALAILPFALSACQSNEIQKLGDAAVSVLQQSNINKTLTAYQWSTQTEGAPKPLILNFDEQGRLSVATSCNTLGTSWKIVGNEIVTGNAMSTMMACGDAAMKQESIAASLFSNRKVAFVLDTKDAQNPSLTLTAENGEKYTFTGKMTPETRYQTQAETIFLEISPETKPCTGVGKQTCLQVREIKYSESGVKTQVDKDWTLFYDQIEGFQHQPDERQVIRVKRYELKNPAADQSKYAYVHDMTIEREAVK